MAQAIVCCNHEGLVLAADSLVLQEEEGGVAEKLARRRLFPLGTHAAILAAGPLVGVELSERLSTWLQARHLDDFDDVAAVGRDFLGEGYARYLRDGHAAPRHLAFILGGCCGSRSLQAQPLLLQSEAGDLPFQEIRLGRVFSLPRRLVLEGRITRQIAEGAELQALAEHCLAGLQTAAERNPEAVGGPFELAIVTPAGVEFLARDS